MLVGFRLTNLATIAEMFIFQAEQAPLESAGDFQCDDDEDSKIFMEVVDTLKSEWGDG